MNGEATKVDELAAEKEEKAKQEVPEKKEETEEERKARLRKLLTTREEEYEPLGMYAEKRPKKLILRRWPWGLGMTLLPQGVQIFGSSLGGLISPQGELAISISSMIGIFTEDNIGKMLTDNSASVTEIIAKTLAQTDDNKRPYNFSSEKEAFDYVHELEFFDIVELGKIIFEQNFEFILKNLLSGLVTMEKIASPNLSPTRK